MWIVCVLHKPSKFYTYDRLLLLHQCSPLTGHHVTCIGKINIFKLLRVGLDLLVQLHVGFQIARGAEAFAANRTLVWLFSGVHEMVFLQMGELREAFSTF